MPLKAIVDRKTIVAPDLSDAEWEDLKLRHRKGLQITMACCGAAGHLRTSKAGTRHFYHAAETGCNYQEESREHLEIKYRIYRICRSEGWETSVEFPAPDRTWISDVCAVKDGRKVVFEIQISAISLRDLEERDRNYRNDGVESYWLLDNYLGSSKEFAAGYDALLRKEDDRCGEKVPYIDSSLFVTGPENHLFITKGIRSVGLNARNQTVFTTHRPELPLADWVRHVLNKNYGSYLENTAAAIHHRLRLKNLAAPALLRFRDFYTTIVRDETYRKTVDALYRIVKNDAMPANERSLQKKFDELYSELDWLKNEYRLYSSESYGLFMWKKVPGRDAPVPVFRLEPASNITKLRECVKTMSRWEESFTTALHNLERSWKHR